MKIRYLIREVYEVTEPYVGLASVERRLLKDSLLVVLDRGNFLGILTPEDIVESPHKLVIDCLHAKPHVDYEQDIESTLQNERKSQPCITSV